jgi:hypothetical protein
MIVTAVQSIMTGMVRALDACRGSRSSRRCLKAGTAGASSDSLKAGAVTNGKFNAGPQPSDSTSAPNKAKGPGSDADVKNDKAGGVMDLAAADSATGVMDPG